MKSYFVLGVIALVAGASYLSAEDIDPLRPEDRSTEDLRPLRGNNQGTGNEGEPLSPGENRTENSIQRRIRSFLGAGKLDKRNRTSGKPDRPFIFSKERGKAPVRGSDQRKGDVSPDASNGGGNEMAGRDTGSQVSTEDALQYVNLHNKARSKVGVKPVAWSRELAEWAQKQATKMARSGEIAHTPNSPYGENLAFGSGPYTVIMAVHDWNAEEQYFKPGEAPRISGNRVTGHYTQMIWNQTREIGAGIATVRKGRFNGWTIVVGVYDPPGNMIGQAPY